MCFFLHSILTACLPLVNWPGLLAKISAGSVYPLVLFFLPLLQYQGQIGAPPLHSRSHFSPYSLCQLTHKRGFSQVPPAAAGAQPIRSSMCRPTLHVHTVVDVHHETMRLDLAPNVTGSAGYARALRTPGSCELWLTLLALERRDVMAKKGYVTETSWLRNLRSPDGRQRSQRTLAHRTCGMDKGKT